jgi:hypothetical protein
LFWNFFYQVKKVNWYLEKPHIFLKGDADIDEVSSTLVREKLKNFYNGSINLTELLPYINNDVLKYIIDNKLYE